MKDYAMKLLLFFAFCFLCLCSAAQISDNQDQDLLNQPDVLKKFKGKRADSLKQRIENYLVQKKIQSLLSNRQGNVAILPQDHMPCVVPDTKDIAPIPNAWKNTIVPYRLQYHPIPNPALPPATLSYKISNNWKSKPVK